MPQGNFKHKTALRGKSAPTALRVVRPTKKEPANNTDPPRIAVDQKQHKKFASVLELILRQFRHKKRTPMPKDLKPMLATLIDKPFDDEDWQFEIKWDGYRTLAYVSGGEVQLRSRNNHMFNDKYPTIVEALKEWPLNAVLDGEV